MLGGYFMNWENICKKDCNHYNLPPKTIGKKIMEMCTKIK